MTSRVQQREDSSARTDTDAPSAAPAQDAFRRQVTAAPVADQIQMLQPPRPLQRRAATSEGPAASVQRRSDGDVQRIGEGPEKKVSPKALRRLGQSRDAIAHTKSVLKFGGGNQKTALEASNFNSYFRMAAMRDPDCWIVSREAARWGRRYPEAMTAAKAGLAAGGNCGEHAAVAFDWLRTNHSSETLNRVAHTMDHAFVLIGDMKTEGGDEIVACDPWPTNPTACLFEDHFGYTTDPEKLKTSNTMTGDYRDVRAIIATGLRLSPKGEAYVAHKFDDERTKKEVKDGTTRLPPSEENPEGRKPWIWNHRDAASSHHEYTSPGEQAPESANYSDVTDEKSMEPEVTFVDGPPVSPASDLADWLKAHKGSLLRLPLAIEVSGYDVGPAWIGVTADDAPDDAIWIDLDQGALSVGLTDRLVPLCETTPTRCVAWVEGYWGPTLSGGPGLGGIDFPGADLGPTKEPFSVREVIGLVTDADTPFVKIVQK